MVKIFHNAEQAVGHTKQALINYGREFKGDSWQSVKAPDSMWELRHHSFGFFMPNEPSVLAKQLGGGLNLNWANEHIKERLSGRPLNPGESYKLWPPYANKPENDKFRTSEERFSHTYMERIWPKSAGHTDFSQLNRGIRYNYGDFSDVINLLLRDSGTRQAFLPIWFPEDTGSVMNQRVPCTIGYLFTIRDNYIDITYYIRSCDYLRHFKDDIYLAVLKVYYVIAQLAKLAPMQFRDLQPGVFVMHISNLHVFHSEKGILKQSNV